MDSCACCGCVQIRCIHTSEVGVLERCGQFSRTAQSGCLWYIWPCESLVARLTLRILQLDVNIATKTKDNVFVNVVVSVQYRVLGDRAVDAYYKLTNREDQIKSYVYDVVRSTLPRMELDAAFESKDDLAHEVKHQLQEKMNTYGYEIVQSLVTDLSPDATVRQAMNEINANKRLRIAAGYRADSEKITLVKAAEADAESKYLSGVGVAKQRKAIMSGLRDSVAEFSGQVSDTTPKDVMNLLLMTQYFDVLGAVGTSRDTNTVFLPYDDGSDEGAQLRNGLLQANAGTMNR